MVDGAQLHLTSALSSLKGLLCRLRLIRYCSTESTSTYPASESPQTLAIEEYPGLENQELSGDTTRVAHTTPDRSTGQQLPTPPTDSTDSCVVRHCIGSVLTGMSPSRMSTPKDPNAKSPDWAPPSSNARQKRGIESVTEPEIPSKARKLFHRRGQLVGQVQSQASPANKIVMSGESTNDGSSTDKNPAIKSERVDNDNGTSALDQATSTHRRALKPLRLARLRPMPPHEVMPVHIRVYSDTLKIESYLTVAKLEPTNTISRMFEELGHAYRIDENTLGYVHVYVIARDTERKIGDEELIISRYDKKAYPSRLKFVNTFIQLDREFPVLWDKEGRSGRYLQLAIEGELESIGYYEEPEVETVVLDD